MTPPEFATASTGDFAFQRDVPAIGRLALRRLGDDDLTTVHAWVTQPYARFWGMTGHSPEQVRAGYQEIARRADVYLGFHDGQPSFLVECYDPAGDPIGAHYAVAPGDRGMHILCAPPARPTPGFTRAAFDLVVDFLFDQPATARIVVEPDIRNAKIHALNRRAGFKYARMVALPHKTAHLAFCTRDHYEKARAGDQSQTGRGAGEAHLQADTWEAANRALVRKALAEFSHERLLEPRLAASTGEWSAYSVTTTDSRTEYHFRARLLPLDHWDIQLASVERRVDGVSVAVDALDLIIDLAPVLGITAQVLPVYLEEIASTLYAAAFKLHHESFTSADLVHADFQEIEGAMTEGHPAFVANSGRVGFDAADYKAYAPEAGTPVQLVWLAAHTRHAEFTAIDGLSHDRLMRRELGGPALRAFHTELRRQGGDPGEYHLIPVHPWQWFNKLATLCAPDLARRDLICLGYGADAYHPQQSLRTFFNSDQAQRCYVKTALSVLNMGFMRGLSADYMRSTPPICAWIDALVTGDAYLRGKGFTILREIAGVGYRSPTFEAAVPKSSPYRKMLAALWRESPVPGLQPGQRLMTMAALLHRDRAGTALLPQLIKASGLDVDAWLARYLDCYLAPLLHCLQRHDLAFMPHGENVILVLEGNVPVRAIMKDIAEEVAIMNTDAAAGMPDAVRRICVSVPREVQPLSIFTDVFDGILRYVSQILLEQAQFPVERFWGRVADCIATYAREQPALPGRRAHDLFAADFARSCLNRLQLSNNRQMLDLTDPAGGLKFAGTLRNPVAAFRDVFTRTTAID